MDNVKTYGSTTHNTNFEFHSIQIINREYYFIIFYITFGLKIDCEIKFLKKFYLLQLTVGLFIAIKIEIIVVRHYVDAYVITINIL